MIFIPSEANAISGGGIVKLFKGIGKIFKKVADEVPDIGKTIEDLKGGSLKSSSKIDDAVNKSSSIDNTNIAKLARDPKQAENIKIGKIYGMSEIIKI